ncbi:MAG: hypothetical protein R3F17_10050 [Planctomycetota bacterium]
MLGSPLNDVRNQHLVNRTDQPYPVYIEVGSSTCADYDAVFDVTPLTCSRVRPGGRLTYPLLLEASIRGSIVRCRGLRRSPS